MFYYESPVGLFTIAKDEDCYILQLDDEILGRYNSPEAAADDVYTQHTGSFLWDSFDLPPAAPTGVNEWQSS